MDSKELLYKFIENLQTACEAFTHSQDLLISQDLSHIVKDKRPAVHYISTSRIDFPNKVERCINIINGSGHIIKTKVKSINNLDSLIEELINNNALVLKGIEYRLKDNLIQDELQNVELEAMRFKAALKIIQN